MGILFWKGDYFYYRVFIKFFKLNNRLGELEGNKISLNN